MCNARSPTRVSCACVFVLLIASLAEAQTGPHGYIGGGFSVEECSACPYQNAGDGTVALIGGGFAYPIIKGAHLDRG